MTSIRRSMAFSFADRYGGYAITMVGVAVLGRLLTPEDFGLFAVGFGIIALIDSIRELGIGNYLVQAREMTSDTARVAFTMAFAMSFGSAVLLLAAAHPLATFYDQPELARMMPVFALNFLLLPFSVPSLSRLRRRVAFDRLAGINLLAAAANTGVAIALAVAGQGYMCFAWAALASTVMRTVAANIACPEPQAFMPSFRGWRHVAHFSGFSTAAAIINVLHDSLPQLLIGRILGIDAAGLYGRAVTVCQLPDRLVTGTIQPVVLPALSAHARSGQSLKQPYLLALTHVSALQWPLLLCLALLADPVVRVLLGPQWTAVPLLVRVMALGSLALFPAFMTYPLLVAIGRIRDTVTMSLISLPPSIAVIAGASFLGLKWVCAAQFINAPLQVYVALRFIQRRIDLTWTEIAGAVRASALVAVCTAGAPAAAVMLSGFRLAEVSVPTMVAAAAAAAAAWMTALRLTHHPLHAELTSGVRFVRHRVRAALG